jgi:hypothetical protein
MKALLLLGSCIFVAVVHMSVDAVRKASGHSERIGRQREAKLMVCWKLRDYFDAHGRYPASITELSFTNSKTEAALLPEIVWLTYRLKPDGGYSLFVRHPDIPAPRGYNEVGVGEDSKPSK